MSGVVQSRRRMLASMFGMLAGCAGQSNRSSRFSLPNGMSPEYVSVSQVAALAGFLHPTIIIGEVHRDHQVPALVASLLDNLAPHGYQTLGVEVSEVGCSDGQAKCTGLGDEIAFLRKHVLSAQDPHEQLGVDLNRPWYEYHGLVRRWNVVPIDPLHCRAVFGKSLDDYVGVRELDMAREIQRYAPLVAVVGSGHLAGLRDLLPGPSYCFLNASSLFADPCGRNDFLCERARAAVRFPRLVL